MDFMNLKIREDIKNTGYISGLISKTVLTAGPA